MVDWSTYVDGGVSVPKFELLDREGNVKTTITLNITASTPAGNVTSRPNRPQSSWVKEKYNAGVTPSGRIVEKTRGFRYIESLSVSLASKDNVASLKTILSHRYNIKYYPHSDNTNRWLFVLVDGDYNYLQQSITLPYYQFQLSVKSLVTIDSIPHDFTRQRVLNHADWTAANFSVTETGYALRALNHSDYTAGSFSDVEKQYGRIPQSFGKAVKDGYMSKTM